MPVKSTSDWPDVLGGSSSRFTQSEDIEGICYIKFPSQNEDLDLVRCSRDIRGKNDGSEPVCPWRKIVMADATPRTYGEAFLPGNTLGRDGQYGLYEWWKTGLTTIGPDGLCHTRARRLAQMCCGNDAAAVAKLEA